MPNLSVVGEVSFDKKEKLGSGEFGTVYQAYDKQLHCDIAIKSISKAIIGGRSMLAFFNECAVIKAAQHPNIIDIYYGCQDCENVYIAMPLYPNGTLADLIAKRSLSLKEVVRIGLDLILGLRHLHRKEYVHGDIKPSNILFHNTGRAILTDFGLARRLNLYGLAAEAGVYHPHIPPEIAGAGQWTKAADLYQLAVTIYRMLFRVQELENPPAKVPIAPHVPEPIRRVINTCLSAEPTDRGISLDLMTALAKNKVVPARDWRLVEFSDRKWEYMLCNDEFKGQIKAWKTPDGKWKVESKKGRNSLRRNNKFCRAGLSKTSAVSIARQAILKL